MYRWLLKSKFLVFIPLVLALVIAVACGADATSIPTTGPTATATVGPTATPEAIDLGLLVSPDANPKRGGTLRDGGLAGPSLFDIHQCSSRACIEPMGNLYDNLVRFDPFEPAFSSVIGDLAKSWEISSDGLEYTFNLRDAKWHDGTDFSADDVVATFQRIANPPEGVISIRFALFEAVTKIEKVDSKTMKFTLREPRGLFLSSLAISWNVIYQAKQLADNNQDLKTTKVPVGTGPFKFVDYNVGEEWDMERNDDYWNPDLPYLDGINIQDLPSGPPTGKAFIAGQLDYGRSLGGADVKAELEKMDDTMLNLFKTSDLCGFWFNVEHPPWDDARLRRAVHWGVSKPDLIQGISHISAFGRDGWMTHADPKYDAYWNKGTPWGNGTPAKDQRGWRDSTDQDIKDAQALVADVLGPGKGLTGVRLVDRDITWSRAYSPILQGLMKQNLGIESILETHPKTIVFEKFQKGEFDIAVQCDSQSLPVLEDYWGLVFWSKGPQNWSKWKNDEFDKLYLEIVGALPGPDKDAKINRAIEILDEEVPFFPNFAFQNLQAWRTWLKGHTLAQSAWLYGPFRWEAAWLDK